MFVNIYLHDRNYGGPEEGGWYYEVFDPVYSVQIHDAGGDLLEKQTEEIKRIFQDYCDRENADRRSDISSVLSEGKYEVYVEDGIAEASPKTKPYYE